LLRFVGGDRCGRALLGITRMVHITDDDRFHEQGDYEPGNLGAPVFEASVGEVGVAICYDRPPLSRVLVLSGAEVVLVPHAGVADEWLSAPNEAEMQVAAFTNGCFIVLASRVGKEFELDFSGESFECGAGGVLITQAPRGRESIIFCDIDICQASTSHAKRLFLKHRRPDLYREWF
jgi:predicted amidohydrolase